MRYLASFAIAAVVGISGAKAQTMRVVADKIVGKVGDRIILKSDITNAIEDAKRQSQEVELPEHPNCIFMEAELIKKALVLQAEKDSLVVEDDDIDAQIEQQVRGFIRMYGSREALEEISGRSVDQLRDDFKKPFKERELANRMRGKILENVKITPIEVKTHFEEIPKDSLPYYESEIEIGQIVVFPKPSREVESYTAKTLNDIKRQIEGGRKFEQMADLYSQDKGTQQQGGILQLNRNDKSWDPAFFNTAFKLKEGQMSGVVKSQFGLHLIKVVSRSGDDLTARHILLIPPVTEDEVKGAKEKLDSVRSKLMAGTLDFGEAVNKYSDDEDKFSGGFITGRDGSSYVTIDQLDKSMIDQIKDMKPGQYSMPTTFADERGRQGVRIIYLRNRTVAHIENMKDDYNRIAQRALAEKKQNILSKWFAEKIGSYFIFVDPDMGDCEELEPWLRASVKN